MTSKPGYKVILHRKQNKNGCRCHHCWSDRRAECKHKAYREWEETSRRTYWGHQYKSQTITYDEMRTMTFVFHESDRPRLRKKLLEIETQIKEIRKRNLISEFKLLRPLKQTARWMNGALALMNNNVPPVAFRSGGWGVDSLGYYGMHKTYEEVKEFIHFKVYPLSYPTYTLGLMQMAGG